MRDILFKAKRKDNGEWVEGYLFTIWGKAYILWGTTNNIPNMIEVIPETVSEHTGLQDKNGTNVFEGDIVNYFGKSYLNSEVIFKNGCFMFKFLSESTQKLRRSKAEPIFKNVSTFGGVIGNIHDNPELLK